MNDVDIVVIGGGLTGTAIAHGCARHRARVAILDEGDAVHRASRGNFGLIWLQGKGLASRDYLNLNTTAIKAWPDFAASLQESTGIDIGWRQPGGLHFCFNPTDVEKRHELINNSAAWAHPDDVRYLDADDLRHLVPQVGPEVLGASYSPLDAHVNPLLLLRATHADFIAKGGLYSPGQSVESIKAHSGGFVVTQGTARFRCKKLVIAAGLGGQKLAKQVCVDLPVRPQRGQIIVTERLKPFFPYVGSCVRQTEEGTVLLGSTHEEDSLDDSTDLSRIDPLIQNGLRVFPHLRHARLIRAWAGLRVMTPDGLPIYEESREFPGAFAVTCHSGLTLMSLHATVVADAIVHGTLPDQLSPFNGNRFHVQKN